MKTLIQIFLVLILILSLVGCSAGQAQTALTTGMEETASTTINASSPQATSSAAASVAEALGDHSETHDDAEDYLWDAATEIAIALNGDSISAQGNGLVVDGSKVTITAPGIYRLSGALSDGQVVVNASGAQVRLILDGVDISNSKSAPIYIHKAEETDIILADNSVNTLTDGSEYVYDDPEAEEPNAALFSDGDLTITGNGALTVNANFADAIASKDGLVIASGTITVNAADDAIRGKDYLVVKSGAVTVAAQGDGLKSDREDDATLGYIWIESGQFNLTTSGDAIHAYTDVMISDGQFNLTSGGGSSTRADEAASAKGIKGLANVNIDGGAFTINAADDGLHSNGNITVNAGSFTIATADDGMHADATLTINGGEVQITESYEGIESAVITINNGDLHIAASDDGVNVAGGVDGSGMNPGMRGGFGRPPAFGGGPGQDTFSAYTGSYYLYLHGGNLTVDADGDGIDVGGAIEMTGGTVLVNGPTNSGNGALDYDGGFSMSGGYLVAAGSAGMAQAPGAASSQASVLIYLPAVQPAGTLVQIQNSAGEEVLTFAPSKTFQSIAFSSTLLQTGETYEIYTGGTSYTRFTISGAVTTVGTGGGGFGRRP